MPIRFRGRAAPDGSALAAELRARLEPDAEIIAAGERRDLYMRDRFQPLRHRETRPALVLRPASAGDVATAVQWACERNLPVTPRGLSTTAHGESLPTRGGLLIDLAQFNRIGPVDDGAGTVHVQAGVTWGDLDAHLESSGLALATYPASRFSTVGGWVSTGGLGINSFGYGHLRRWVAALEVVTGAGEVRTLTPRDKLFAACFGAEGSLGVVTGITLRLRPAPDFARAHLFYFDSTAEQLEFVRHLIASRAPVAHVGLFDPRYMAYQNRLYEEAHPDRTAFYEVRPAALIHVDSVAQERALEDALARAETLVEEGPDYAAAALWQGRFYPLALKRFGPSLLTAPVVTPLLETAAFIDGAMRLGERFGLSPAAWGVVAAADGGYEALVMPLFPCDARRRSYRLHVLMAHLITRAAIRRGGRPYTVGSVNAPFAAARFGPDWRRAVQAHKRAVDQAGLLNPRPRAGLSAALLRPALRVAETFKAQVGQVARSLHRGEPPATPPRPRSSPLADAELEATINACTGCGNCIPVCPAFLVTHDEITTGRAKLQTGLRVLRGGEVSQERADATFLCTYCKACQDVCEAELPLIAAYAAIEGKLAAAYGRPDRLIAEFVAQAESSAEYRRFVGVSGAPDSYAQPLLHLHDETPEPRRSGAAFPPLPQGEEAAAGERNFAPSRRDPVGPFNVIRSEHCVNCGQCVPVCPADVHRRREDDPRLMAQPVSRRCVGCFLCVQECPARALTLTPSPAYAGLGRGVYTPEIVTSLNRQAETGRASATPADAELRALAGFEGIRLDAGGLARRSRQPGETAVTLGRRLERLTFDEAGAVKAVLPPTLTLALPAALALPLVATDTSEALNQALIQAARHLDVLALVEGVDGGAAWADAAAWVAPRIAAADLDRATESLAQARLVVVDGLERVIARLRTRHPGLMLAAEAPLDRHAAEAALRLAHAGADIVILTGRAGLDDGESDVVRCLPEVHEALISASRRERVSLLVRGDIATAAHMVQALLLGADAVVIDWSLLVALEHRLNDSQALTLTDVAWATQRLVNLVSAWRDQLAQWMAGLGVERAHHLRGAQGRAIFESAAHIRNLGHLRRVPDPSLSDAQLLGR